MDCDFGEFLDSVRGQSSAYCSDFQNHTALDSVDTGDFDDFLSSL